MFRLLLAKSSQSFVAKNGEKGEQYKSISPSFPFSQWIPEIPVQTAGPQLTDSTRLEPMLHSTLTQKYAYNGTGLWPVAPRRHARSVQNLPNQGAYSKSEPAGAGKVEIGN